MLCIIPNLDKLSCKINVHCNLVHRDMHTLSNHIQNKLSQRYGQAMHSKCLLAINFEI